MDIELQWEPGRRLEALLKSWRDGSSQAGARGRPLGKPVASAGSTRRKSLFSKQFVGKFPDQSITTWFNIHPLFFQILKETVCFHLTTWVHMVLKLNGGRNVVFPPHNLRFSSFIIILFFLSESSICHYWSVTWMGMYGVSSTGLQSGTVPFCENWKKPQFISSRNSTKWIFSPPNVFLMTQTWISNAYVTVSGNAWWDWWFQPAGLYVYESTVLLLMVISLLDDE